MSGKFVVTSELVKLLKNYAGIQNSVLLRAGSRQTTMSTSKSLFALSEFGTPLPQDVGIYDLNTFLGTLSLFSKPEIEFDGNVMVVSDVSGAKVKYRMSDPSNLLVPPADEPGNRLQAENPSVVLSLSSDTLQRLNKSVSVLGLNGPSGLISFSVAGDQVTIRAYDEKNPAAHTFELKLAEKDVTVLKDFTRDLHFRTSYMSMLLDGGYHVSLSDWKYGYFKHVSDPISYYVVSQSVTKP